jgi:hypothetical protein
MQDRPRARTDEVITDQVEEDLVVYDQSNQIAHALSAEAASVWQACDGQRSVDVIASDLKLEVPVVERALQELSDCRLLRDDPTIDLGHRVSRREAAKKFAKVGAAALAAPMIYSVAVPGAAMAVSACSLTNGQTPGTATQNCTAAPGTTGSSGPTTGGGGLHCCASGVCYETHAGVKTCIASDLCVSYGGLCVGILPLLPCCAGASACSGIALATCTE